MCVCVCRAGGVAETKRHLVGSVTGETRRQTRNRCNFSRYLSLYPPLFLSLSPTLSLLAFYQRGMVMTCQKHNVIEELEEHLVRKKHPKQRSKRAFGPLTPSSERPLVLPGGRRWYRPKDAYNDEFIAETLSAQAELITGSTLGWVEPQLPPNSLTPNSRLANSFPRGSVQLPLLALPLPLSIAIDIGKAILCAILPWSPVTSPQSPSLSRSHISSSSIVLMYSSCSCSFLIFHGTRTTTTTTTTTTLTAITTTTTTTTTIAPRAGCNLHNFAH